jgi:hypothetical protein
LVASTTVAPSATAVNTELDLKANLTANTFTEAQTITPAVNTTPLTINASLTGSSAVPFLDVAGTWNTSGLPTAILLNVTDVASNANSNLIDLRVGGGSRFNVTKSGNLGIAGNFTGVNYSASTTAGYNIVSRLAISATANGVMQITNGSFNDFVRMNLGGATSSFPSIKKSGTSIDIVLADDSGFASTQSLYARFGSGSPEGVVTAPIGAFYSRTNGGALTSFYVKESGTGNTGWVAK